MHAAALSANTAMLLPELAAAERLCGARLEKIEAMSARSPCCRAR